MKTLYFFTVENGILFNPETEEDFQKKEHRNTVQNGKKSDHEALYFLLGEQIQQFPFHFYQRTLTLQRETPFFLTSSRVTQCEAAQGENTLSAAFPVSQFQLALSVIAIKGTSK